MIWQSVRAALARVRLVPLVAAALLIVVAGGTALALRAPVLDDNRGPQAVDPTGAPEADDPEAPPTADELARVVDRLGAAGVDTNVETVAALAAEHGVGGAVRLLAWSQESGRSVDEIAALRAGDATTAPMGWGRIARELGVHPGIGHIMGGGHGRDDAPGQNRD